MEILCNRMKYYYINIISKRGKLLDFLDRYNLIGLRDASVGQLSEYVDIGGFKDSTGTKTSGTNADRIRSMTDEELAEFIAEISTCEHCYVKCSDKEYCPSISSCVCRHLEWLQKEVE